VAASVEPQLLCSDNLRAELAATLNIMTGIAAFALRRWVKSLDDIHICVLGCTFRIRWC
jgi:hypothetical protein